MKNISSNKINSDILNKKISAMYDFFEKNHLTELASYSEEDLLNIKELDLSSSKLTYLPDEIDVLVNLHKLDVCNNNLEKLPESICNLANLRYIDVSFNKLKSLPKKIISLQNIEEIDIYNNLFKI